MRREGGVEGRAPSKGCVSWGEVRGSAMATRGRGKVGEGFDPDAKRGEDVVVCEMWGGGRTLREAWPIPWSLFFFFFFFL